MGAVLLRLPGASDDWSLPDDLRLNATPYQRSVRQMFYDDVAAAMRAAVADPTCPRRMQVRTRPRFFANLVQLEEMLQNDRYL